jgi:hypothetical protein
MKWKILAVFSVVAALGGCFGNTYDVGNDFTSTSPFKAGIYADKEGKPVIVTQMPVAQAVAKAQAPDRSPGNIYVVSTVQGTATARFFLVSGAEPDCYILQLSPVPAPSKPTFQYGFACKGEGDNIVLKGVDTATLPSYVRDLVEETATAPTLIIKDAKRDTSLVLRVALADERVTRPVVDTYVYQAPLAVAGKQP